MTKKSMRAIISKSLPQAKFVKSISAPKKLMLSADARTPDMAALIKKYGSVGLVRSAAKSADTAVRKFSSGAEDIDVCEVVIESPSSTGGKKSLRRTVVVDKKAGRIIGGSG